MKRRNFVMGAIAIAALQSTAVAAMIYNRANKIKNGREILLESTLVDPRDLFRGHYVTLNLSVGTLAEKDIQVDRKFLYDDPVFVELVKGDGQFWIAKKLWHELPQGTDKAYLKGRVTSVPVTNRKNYRINFPFDRFFAPKKRAKELENVRRDGNLGVALSVAGDGSGYIKGIVVEGKVIYDEPLF